MDTEANKENLNPIERLINEDLKNISIDSLTQVSSSPTLPAERNVSEIEASTSPMVNQSLGPALVGTSSFDSQPADTTPTFDEPATAAATPPQDAIASSTAAILKAFAEDGDTSVGISPALTTGTPVSLPVDGPSLREAEEYADDLARALINDTNRLVRREHSHEEDSTSEQQHESSGSQAAEEQVTATEVGVQSFSEQVELRSFAEQERAIEESASETERPADEADRMAEDTERQTEETEWQTMETDRQNTETERQTVETERQTVETELQSVETERQNVENEKTDRATEKTERQDDMNEFRMAMNDMKDDEELIGADKLSISASSDQEAQMQGDSGKEDNLLEFSVDDSRVQPEPSAEEQLEEELPQQESPPPEHHSGDQEAEPDQVEQDNDSVKEDELREELVSIDRRISIKDEEEYSKLHDQRESFSEAHDTSDLADQNQDDSINQFDILSPPPPNYHHDTQHQSFQTAAGNSIFVDGEKVTDTMEFTKNYSDDLLMGQNDGIQQGEPTNADLADFELPPYSGSSSGSEPKQHSPVRRKSSSTAAQAPSSSLQVNASPPNLTAVKKLLVAGYSRVANVIHWKKPIETGVIFAVGLTIIIALTFFSIISVVAYTAIVVVMSSSLLRAYKFVMKTLKRPSETPVDHIWNRALDTNVTISPEKMHQLIDSSLANLNASLVYFKQVLLMEDRFETLKFCIFLYPVTYIGAWFNGMTLITLAYLGAFSMPILYEKNKTKIDGYVNLASSQVSSSLSMVTSKVSSLAFCGSSPSASTSSGAAKKRD